jgi:hypothetical protein
VGVAIAAGVAGVEFFGECSRFQRGGRHVDLKRLAGVAQIG